MCRTGYASGFALGDLITPLAAIGFLLCVGGFIHGHYFAREASAADIQAAELLEELSSDLAEDDGLADGHASNRRRAMTARREVPVSVSPPDAADSETLDENRFASRNSRNSLSRTEETADSSRDSDSRTAGGKDAKLRARWSSKGASSRRRAASGQTRRTAPDKRSAPKISRRKIEQIASRQNDRWNALMDEDM